MYAHSPQSQKESLMEIDNANDVQLYNLGTYTFVMTNEDEVLQASKYWKGDSFC